MDALVSSNIGLVCTLLFLAFLIHSILITLMLRRIKTLMAIASWSLLFERLISSAFKKEIETFLNEKKTEFDQEIVKHQKTTNLYDMHKDIVSSSPITSPPPFRYR